MQPELHASGDGLSIQNICSETVRTLPCLHLTATQCSKVNKAHCKAFLRNHKNIWDQCRVRLGAIVCVKRVPPIKAQVKIDLHTDTASGAEGLQPNDQDIIDALSEIETPVWACPCRQAARWPCRGGLLGAMNQSPAGRATDYLVDDGTTAGRNPSSLVM